MFRRTYSPEMTDNAVSAPRSAAPRKMLPLLRSKRRAIFLAGIVLCAAALSMYWVFLVPIYEAPDEQTHLDYAFNIYSAGRPINVREPYHRWNFGPLPQHGEKLGNVYHVYTSYLIQVSDLSKIAFNPVAKAPLNYRTRRFYGDLDLHAPPEMSGDLEGQRKLWDLPGRNGYQDVYPFGYYAATAAWLRLVRLFSGRLSVLFFGARSFSVLLLVCSLLLVYANALEMRFSHFSALLLTAVVGFFPLTSFVSSYVQPDNLCLTLVLLCSYLALVLRRKPDGRSTLALLGVALGILSITKSHTFVAVFLPILAMLIADKIASRMQNVGWRRLVLSLGIPLSIGASMQVWVTWGSSTGGLISNANTVHTDASLALSQGTLAFINFLMDGLGGAFSNFYLNGSTFQSFWGLFGWMDTPLIIVSPGIEEAIRSFIALLNCIVFGLALVRLERIITRLIVVARRGRPRRALSIAFSKPLMNSYFLFTAGLFLLYMLVRNQFSPQGRDWFPFIMPIFLVGIDYAPKALTHRRTRRAFSIFIMAGLALYCLVGGYCSIQSVIHRFYGP
jgi:hypothetical protein